MRTFALLPLLIAGCAPVATQPPVTQPATGRCNADAAQALVGQAGTSATAQEALRLSGARDLRWIRPGMAVTMDYREDRLHIEIDARERIVAIRCG